MPRLRLSLEPIADDTAADTGAPRPETGTRHPFADPDAATLRPEAGYRRPGPFTTPDGPFVAVDPLRRLPRTIPQAAVDASHLLAVARVSMR